MKMPTIISRKIPLLTAFFILSAMVLRAQDAKDKEALLKDLITSKHYIFNAESVSPASGRLRLLNSGERVEISGDTLVTELPYFGRAYTAPIDPSQGGFHFTSTNFGYTVSQKKKGGWTVVIKLKDNRDAQQLTFDIYSGGTATLQITSNNRQSISFNGQVVENKKTSH